jgi:hypothetical protein
MFSYPSLDKFQGISFKVLMASLACNALTILKEVLDLP